MGQVITVGGIEVDGPGVLIRDGRVIPIPPWEPGFRLRARGLSALVAAEALDKQKGRFADPVARHLLGQVEQQVGRIGKGDVFAFMDVDGGFICGSTGRPRPIGNGGPR